MKTRFINSMAAKILFFIIIFQVGIISAIAIGKNGFEDENAMCENHLVHDIECGYMEAAEESPCMHVQGEECYLEVLNCVHVCNEDCKGEMPEEECPHICTIESECITYELACEHIHDEACGFMEAQEGAPCTHVCPLCMKDDDNYYDIEEMYIPEEGVLSLTAQAVFDCHDWEEVSAEKRMELMEVAAELKKNDMELQLDELLMWTSEVGLYSEESSTIGTVENPFIITNREHLEELSSLVNRGLAYQGKNFYSEACYSMERDIDATNLNNFIPIGADQSNSFRGTFNGNHYTITGIEIMGSQYAGVFGYLENGTVKNLNMVEGYIEGTDAGSIAGFLDGGNIMDCAVFNKVSGIYAGGITGEVVNGGQIVNCTNKGEITSTDLSGIAGGISACLDNGTIENSYNLGAAISENMAAGIVGRVTGSSAVANCYSKGNVDSIGMGGSIVAYLDNGMAENCFGLVNSAAQIVGHVNAGSVTDCAEFELDGKILNSDDSIVAKLNEWAVNANGNSIEDIQYYYWTDNASPQFDRAASLPSEPVSELPAHTWMEEGNYDINWYAENPDASEYTIYTAAELAGMAYLNDHAMSFEGKTIYLGADIDLGEYRWIPAHTSERYFFRGIIDGKGHVISNMKTENGGLFVFFSGEIRNVGFENINVINTKTNGFSIGIIGGYVSGTVKNCYVTGNITAVKDASGLVGKLNGGVIENCYNACTIIGSGSNSIAGIAQTVEAGGRIKNCYNSGELKNAGYASGIVDIILGDTARPSSVVSDCYNIGKISEANIAGGICRMVWSGNSVQNCYNAGEIEGKTAGGIAGETTEALVQNCYNVGNITGSEYCGGIAGLSQQNTIIDNCYNLGSIFGTKAGNIVGLSKGGGFNFHAEINNCFWPSNSTIPGYEITGGTTSGCNTFDEYGIFDDATTLSNNLNVWVDLNKNESGIYRSWTNSFYPEFDSYQDKKGYWTDEGNYDAYWLNYGIPDNNIVKIGNAKQLAALAKTVNDGINSFAGVTFILQSDIDLSAHEWIPIGRNMDTPFEGSFGNGYSSVITGLHVNSAEYAGLFGYVKGNDNSISNVYINDGTINGTISAGAVVGLCDGSKVDNCYSNADVFCDGIAGGITGWITNNGEIDRSYSMGKVENRGSSSAVNAAGGVAGVVSTGEVKNSYSNGVVKADPNNGKAGGIVGWMNLGTVENCTALNRVVSAWEAGRVAGTLEDGAVLKANYASGRLQLSNLSGRAITDNRDGIDGEEDSLSMLVLNTTLFPEEFWILQDGYYPRFIKIYEQQIVPIEEQSEPQILSVKLLEQTLSLTVGEVYQLHAEVQKPSSSNKKLSWTSSDSSIVSVNSEGEIQAVSSGTAIITAQIGDKSSECVVVVLKDSNQNNGNSGSNGGDESDDSGDIGDSGTRPSRGPSGVITKDPIKGQVNTVSGIVTGHGTGKSEWIKDSQGWKLEYADGSFANNTWELIDGSWFYFDNGGYSKAGWIYDTTYNGWFLTDVNGMKTGWQQINGKWYYLNPASDGAKGKMLTNTWIGDYYVGENGEFVEGKKKGNWKKENHNWQMLYEDGSYAQNAWDQINGEWYYFGNDTYAKEGWFFDAQYNGWFLLDVNKGMRTGWQFVNGKWYYLNPVSNGYKGKMAVSTVIDGYPLNKDGSWTGK